MLDDALPDHLGTDTVFQGTDVDARTCQSRRQTGGIEIVLGGHAIQNPGHLRVAGRNAELPAFLELEVLRDQHFRGLLSEFRTRLRLGGQLQKSLSLCDVVVGDWIVVDQQLDLHVLRLGAECGEQQQQHARGGGENSLQV
nr:hypothetical protein [Methyloceanibacter sp. wino2]